MLDLIALVLSIGLLPFIICRTDKNGILFCKISLAIGFSIILCEIIAIIVKINTGEYMIFNLLALIFQSINITSFAMSLYAYKEMNKKQNHNGKHIEDIVV